jgi:hypothetical protein
MRASQFVAAQMEHASEAYHLLHDDKLQGCAMVTPHG